jgi:hypothetical protein
MRGGTTQAVIEEKGGVQLALQALHLHARQHAPVAEGESRRLVVESPWSQLTSACQRFGHPPRLAK